MGALILLALLTTTLSLRSQEVTYNTTPTHQLGPQLWQLPIGGQLTMSRDGKTLLVASMADTCFYIVDVERGSIDRRSVMKYRQGRTYYAADAELKWIAVGLNQAVEVYRLSDDSLMRRSSPLEGGITAISSTYDRLLGGRLYVCATTFDTIAAYSEHNYTTGWFDDDRGLLYRCVPNAVQEIDAVTGTILRSWGTNARTFSRAIRPSNSMWLYVFAWPETDKPESTFVDAIHLETGERVHYTHEYAGGGPVAYETTDNSYEYSTPTKGLMCSWAARGFNYLCSFDGSTRSSQAVVSPLFKWGTRTSTKENAVNPELSLYLHTWDEDARARDSVVLRCNALIPVASAVADGPTPDETRLLLQVEGGILLVVAPQGVPMLSIDIISTDGRILQHHTGEELDRQPLQVNIAGLPSGSYICAVQFDQRRLLSSFTITR